MKKLFFILLTFLTLFLATLFSVTTVVNYLDIPQTSIEETVVPTERSIEYKTNVPVIVNQVTSYDLPVVNNKFSNSKDTIKIKASENQVIYITGPIGGNAASINREILYKARAKKPLYLVLDSPGGSVVDGASIITTMESAGVPIYTVCSRMCASMAFIILEYGTKRYATNRSFLMAHPASGSFEGSFPIIHSRLKAFSDFTDSMNDDIAKRMGISLEKFKSMENNELWVEAKNALPLNLIDRIIQLDTDAKDSSIMYILESNTLDKFSVQWR